MAEFLTTSGTSFNLENIILEAKTKLILVSPYLQISKTFYERLKDASNRNVAIKIIYGKNDLKETEKKQIAELDNLELFFFENLHAKCYFNENKMIITSMNMYQFSEKNNREMGVLISRKLDTELFEKAVNETLSIIKSAEKVELIKKVIYKEKTEQKSTTNYKKAFCIRCNEKVRTDIEKPFCNDCYNEWNRFRNPEYIENYCHYCGDRAETTMWKPIEKDCFNNYRNEN
jgi:phosphatidylserine/phosphatidylglycerophosphate/cardiolipin synthase-like enzyme